MGWLGILDRGIVVEGVSMAAAQKSEFEAVISKVGVNGLVGTLRSKLGTKVARGS